MIWAKNDRSGRWMILGAERVLDGNVVFVEGCRAHVICAGEMPDARLPRYLDHHATCPQAKEWLRK